MKKILFTALVCLLMACTQKVEKSNVEVAAINTVNTSNLGQPKASSVVDSPVDTETGNFSSSTELANRTADENDLQSALEVISSSIEAKKLAYVSELKQDCSGIFHQIADSIQLRIPSLADESKYAFPAFESERNSRQIANWYYQNNNLLIVQDPMAARNEIRPGSVMFFGRSEEKYENVTIDLLTNPGKFTHDGDKGKIMHIAVVTSVEKDEAGNVIKYTMMHGRNPKYPASRTDGNYDGAGGYAKAYAKFPFGNWNQQWVAMANIETAK